jgi:biopolymer transport protein TolR
MGAKLQGRSRGRRSSAVMSDINVTPFVDVMLVLLVIFMVTAPLLTAGVQVDLPRAEAKAISQNDNAPLEVSVDRKGTLYVGENRVEMARMKAQLAAIAAEAPDRRVYIRADQGLDYGRVMEVMAAVSGAGFTKIALISDQSRK